MDRRAFSASSKSSGKSSAKEPPKGARPHSPDAPLTAERAQLFIECTRAILRAADERGLASTLCQLLFLPSLYAEVCLVLTKHDADRRLFFAGADKDCLNDPERFWAPPTRAAALEAVLTGDAPRIALPESDACVFALAIEGQAIGALAVTPARKRVLDSDELEQLQLLADDMGFAFSRLRDDASHRSLAASERRLRDTVEHAGVGITRIDAGGHFIEVNQRFCRMLGYTRDELVGRPTRDVTVPEDYGPGATFREQARQGRAVAAVHTSEKRYLHKDGRHVWARRTLSPAFDEHGKLRDAVSIVEDITERKAAEEATLVERALLRTIIDAVPHYIYVKDDAGHITLANRAWLAARGCTLQEIQGKTAYDLFPAAAAAKMEAEDREVLSGTPLYDSEQRGMVSSNDGSHKSARWSSTTKVPLRNAAGKVIGVVGISIDISESKRVEQELREYGERFEMAARATSDAIWDWDLTTGTLWWGEGLEKLFNHRREDVGSAITSWTDRIHPDEVKTISDGIHAAIDGAARVWSADYRFRRADGTWADVYDRAYIMRDADGRAFRMLGAMMDISARKRAEEAIRRERVLLRTIIDALPDFIHVKDAQGHIQLGNKAWLKARGLQDQDVFGKSVFDVFPRDAAKRMDEQDRNIIASGEPVLDQEHPLSIFNDDGVPVQRWSATTKVPMRDEDGNIVGVVGFSRDITSRRRLERERAMEHAVARALSESRSVADTMPHLIRTICEAMDWSYGAYWLWDAASESLKRTSWWSAVEPEFDPADETHWKELTTLYTTGLLGKAWLEQRATWVSDVFDMPGFRRAASCRKLGLRSAFAFPILAADERVGMIEFFGKDAREPDQALLEVSDAVSKQIGQFILRKEAEESLQESEQQLRAVFDQADVGMAMTGLDTQYLRVNDKYCSIVGYDREELLSMRVSDVNLEANIAAMRDYRSRMLRENMPAVTVEKQLVRKDGSLVWVSMATSLVRASDGAPRHFIAVIQDISENKRAAEALKESEEQFRVLAHYDLLTGLPNRALFYDRLAQALAHARRNRWWLAVLFIDLDRFKHVNDTFGHAAGDQLLKQVSERLADCVRSDDTVGRLSGDEFAIVLSRLTAPSDASVVATKIIDSLNKPFALEGTELFVTVSIGITVFPTDSVDQDALIRNADVAMYRAKDRGRNNYQFYTPEMNRRTREMLNMESELRRAIERDEFVLHYQPKVSLKSGQITGVEALLRWQHPERGLVSPADFIPLLEETGLVVQAGDWVLRAVCRQLNEWRATGVQVVPVAVNLSARQFLSRDLGETIKAILAESGVEPALLEVEITESAIMSDIEEANRTLEYLQSIGVKSAIDDFGTGYSSLGYLKRFPLKALKVDRSFVSEITTDADDANITQAVISMAHSLGLIVIAEGVETEAQLAYLLRYGCDEVQGYLFSRPVPAAACAAAIVDYQRTARLIDVVRNRAD